MNIIAIIPARGGSKGVQHKNMRLLNDQPLVVHSIKHAQESQYISNVYVSTDDEKIGLMAKNAGAKVINRPIEISGDEASSESALIHALNKVNDDTIDYVVFLQCTSPFRTANDIDNAISKILQQRADSLLSVVKSHKFLWQEIEGSVSSVNYDYTKRPRRQDMEVQYQENGSIYIFKPWVLKQTHNRLGGKISLFEMPQESAIDIDSEIDFKIAEALIVKL